MKKRRSLTVSQLMEIYQKCTHGDTHTEVAHQLKLAPPTIYQAMDTLRKYIAVVIDGRELEVSHLRRNYLKAAQWAIEEDKISRMNKLKVVEEADPFLEQLISTSESKPEVEEGRYGRLDSAFSTFSKSLYAFIEEEVLDRVGEVVRENEELKTLLPSAKESNWTYGLKKHFEGK